jgi:hypothetical protein
MRFALLMMAGACLCRAENACPWLNAATAAGVLGSAVTASVKPGVCEFRAGKSELRIQVNKKADFTPEKCATPSTPLKGLGNEAEICSVGMRILGGWKTEYVFGHVRDRMFGVSISTSDHSMDSLIREKTRKVAEQVAGSLF